MKVVLWGDSLFARNEGESEPHIEVALRQYLPDIETVNYAERGNNSYDLLEKLATYPKPPADKTVVLIGTNDLAIHKQISVDDFRSNMKKVVQRLSQHYAAGSILLLAPPLVDEDKQTVRTNRLIRLYGAVVAQVATESGCGFLDLAAVFEHSSLGIPRLLKGELDDGLHFGAEGYALLAEALSDALQD